MAIYRTSKEDRPFVMLDKTSLEDPRLSMAAKGLHAYLMSRPDNWTPRINQLTKICSNGKAHIKTTLRNLEEAGYVWKRKIRDEQGRFQDWEYVIFETPRAENPFSETPRAEKPTSEKPRSENRPFNNNYKDNNNDSNNIPPIVPQKKSEEPDSYEEFMEVHPAGKMGKPEGRKNWNLCLEQGWTKDQLLSAAKKYAHFIEMREKMDDDVKVKYPQGFLNPKKLYFEPWIPGNENREYQRTLARFNKQKTKGVAPVSDFSNVKKGEWKRHA